MYTTKTKIHTKDSWSESLYLLFNAMLKIEDLLKLNEILLCSFFLIIFYHYFFLNYFLLLFCLYYYYFFCILMGVLFVCLFVCFLFFLGLIKLFLFCFAWLLCFALLIMIESRIAQRQNIKPRYLAETVIKALVYFYIYS